MAKEDKQTSNELQQFVPAGLRWLYEMEAVNSPVLLNNLYGNIFSFPNVKDAEILIDKNNRKMLILIQFNWITRNIFKKRKKETIINILDQLQELLPSFAFRVIEDRKLFDLAVQKMREASQGGPNEKHDRKPTDSKPTDAAPNGKSDIVDDNGAAFIAAAQANANSAEGEQTVTQTDSKESSETE